MEKINPNALLIGFARRFATYKRAHLLLTDLERLSKIVNNPDYLGHPPPQGDCLLSPSAYDTAQRREKLRPRQI